MQLLRKGGTTISATRLPTLLFPLLQSLLVAHSMPQNLEGVDMALGRYM